MKSKQLFLFKLSKHIIMKSENFSSIIHELCTNEVKLVSTKFSQYSIEILFYINTNKVDDTLEVLKNNLEKNCSWKFHEYKRIFEDQENNFLKMF